MHPVFEVQAKEENEAWLSKAAYRNRAYAVIYKDVLKTAGKECRLLLDGVPVQDSE